ncbi:MAG: hypothetical protein L0H84_01005 [Pseudonocardia sp.]|nr:hypothetical protein [Pseudonocardia sp.]
MATQYTQTLVNNQQKILDAALERFALVRKAADETNLVRFQAVKDYVDLAKEDLAAVAADERPSVGDLIARGYDRAAQVMSLQDKAMRSLAEAWAPVLNRVVTDAVRGVEDAAEETSTAKTAANNAKSRARSATSDG